MLDLSTKHLNHTLGIWLETQFTQSMAFRNLFQIHSKSKEKKYFNIETRADDFLAVMTIKKNILVCLAILMCVFVIHIKSCEAKQVSS